MKTFCSIWKTCFLKFGLFGGIIIILVACQSLSLPGEYERISDKPDDYSQAIWSPDGGKILYINDYLTILDLNEKTEYFLPVDIQNSKGSSTVNWLEENKIAYSVSYWKNAESRESVLYLFDLENEQAEKILSVDGIFRSCWNSTENVFLLVMYESTGGNYFRGNTIKKFDPQTEEITTLFKTQPNTYIHDVACNLVSSQVAITINQSQAENEADLLTIIDVSNGNSKTIAEVAEMKLGTLSWSPNGEWIMVQNFPPFWRGLLRRLWPVSYCATRRQPTDERGKQNGRRHNLQL